MTTSDFRHRYGPWAVVTGASDGIGRAFAQGLAARGLHLVLVARRAPALEALAADLRAHHGVDSRVVAVDLTDAAAMTRLDEATGGLDVGLLVAAAGFGTAGPLLDSVPAREQEMLSLNAGSVLAQCLQLGPRLARRGRGGVVLMSSLVAFQGAPGAAHYAATKAYVQTLAEGLRHEWRAFGVDVIACAPGPVASGFAARAGMRMGRTDSPEAVAQATLAALGRRGTVRPGTLSKLLGWSLATAPRALRVHIMGRIMAGMVQARR